MNVYSYARIMVFFSSSPHKDELIPFSISLPNPPKWPAGQIVWTLMTWVSNEKIPMRSRRELNTYFSLVGGGTSIHFSIRWECLFALKRPGFFSAGHGTYLCKGLLFTESHKKYHFDL